MRLKDKIGIVTAAASGMGRAGALRSRTSSTTRAPHSRQNLARGGSGVWQKRQVMSSAV